MSKLILCADDFGLSPEISETIVELAKAGRINATSCMTSLPDWEQDSALLHDLPPHFQIGLHLTLTLELPATDMPTLAPNGWLPTIHTLERLSRRGTLPLDEIAGEIRAQFDRFEAALGRAPDFVDGHQHCHAIKGIREIVLAETASRAPKAWIRTCEDSIGAMWKRPFTGKAIGSAYHSRGLAADAARLGLTCNDSFAGHYGFAGDYEEMFPQFLRKANGTHLVMCHPGAGMVAGDDIATARAEEARALRRLPVAELAAAGHLSFPG